MTVDPADDNLPAWSPDGQWLAFQSDRSGHGMHLYKVRPDGSQLTALTSGPASDRSPAWAPDGRRLAFYSDRSGEPDQLFAVPADGGRVEQLATTPGRAQLPAWSPDGQWLVFASESGDGWDLWLLQLDQRTPRLLARGPHVWAPTWGATR